VHPERGGRKLGLVEHWGKAENSKCEGTPLVGVGKGEMNTFWGLGGSHHRKDSLSGGIGQQAKKAGEFQKKEGNVEGKR